MVMHGGIKIDLTPSQATEMTPEVLKAQLNALGLTCSQADMANLPGYIADVRSRLPNGNVPAFFIGRLKSDGSGHFETSNGPWVATDDPPDNSQLLYICNKVHFDWLRANDKNFTGSAPLTTTDTTKYGTVDAVKAAYEKIGLQLSQSLVTGLDPVSVESKLQNTIDPMIGSNANDYDSGLMEDAILIAEDYNVATHEAGGVGFIGVQWRIVIKDYQKKDKKHDTNITVTTWSNIYTSDAVVDADYAAAQKHFD